MYALLRPKVAAERAGISISHLYALQAEGNFPRSVKVSERITAFVESEVDEWIAAKIKAARSQEVA